MILYLSSNENLNIFDFLSDGQNMLIEKLSGEFFLKKFVIHETRTFNHYRYIIIDLDAVEDPMNDIIEALKALKIMYDARVILLAGKTNTNLLNQIIDETNIYNIIFGKTLEKIKEQIKICIGQGMTKHYVKININLNYDRNKDVEIIVNNPHLNTEPIKNKLNKSTSNRFSFNDKNIKILITGTMPRVGTTTTAINMACYLASIGARVSYTEGNKNNHLNSIHSHFFFNNPIVNNFFTDSGVDYYFDGNIPIEGYNFNIVDIGVLGNQNIKLLEELGDVKILCGGTKPYEIKEVQKVLELVDSENVKVLLPGNDLSSKEKIIKEQNLLLEEENLYYSKFSFDMFDDNINTEIFELILNEYIGKIETDRAI